MPYITSVERIGREEGRKEGLEEGRQKGRQEGRHEGLREGLLDGIELAMKLKFGEAGQSIVPEIRELVDLSIIRAVYTSIEDATAVDDIRRVYQ